MRPCDAQAAGLYVYFEVFGERAGCNPGEARLGGRKVLMFGSNDYLDLTAHPKVKEAAEQAVLKYGTGAGGARPSNGSLDLHARLEAELAALTRKEDALIFATGFQANYGVLSTLPAKNDALVCDHNLHASLVEGALGSPARVVRFRHNDMPHLEQCLKHCALDAGVLIVSEGVFSMEGDLADLSGTVDLAGRYGARVYVDEAHGIGVLGPTGAGAAEHFDVLDKVDCVMGTFSKSLASAGGFVASTKAVIEYLKHTAPPFLYSAAPPPASTAAVLAALEIMRREPERRERLRTTSSRLRFELRSAGFSTLGSRTPIVPVVIEDQLDVFRFCRMLLDEGIYVNPVLRPAASCNMLRISCTAGHSDAQVDRLVETLRRISRQMDGLKAAQVQCGRGAESDG